MRRERWIQRYFLSHPEEFKRRVITFESRWDAGEKVRRMDVTVGSVENMVYYEFKSVTNIPPKNFAEQFLKDLEIANDLSQIKWYFDGKKISTLNKELFLQELEKVEIKRELIEKWVGEAEKPSKESLLVFIEEHFDEIFKIK